MKQKLSDVFSMLEENRRPLLYALLIMQVLCMAFFIWDSISELTSDEPDYHPEGHVELEGMVVLALVASLAFTAHEIFALIRRNNSMESQLKVASGAFSELLEEYFIEWGLTRSEQDVALLAIKGLSISEIAQLRQTKDGTVKAQLNAIYRKADVSSRTQLVTLFIEELMTGVHRR